LREERRIHGGAVTCVDIMRKVKCEGSLLAQNWRWGTKAWGANRIRYPGSPRHKRCWLLFGRQKNRGL